MQLPADWFMILVLAAYTLFALTLAFASITDGLRRDDPAE